VEIGLAKWLGKWVEQDWVEIWQKFGKKKESRCGLSQSSGCIYLTQYNSRRVGGVTPFFEILMNSWKSSRPIA
jgi:hypothetical protein